MIVVTGAGGFIGSAMVGHLNSIGITDILAVDDMPHPEQYKNLVGKSCRIISTSEMETVLEYSPGNIQGIIHLGANSNTLANDWASVYKTNVLSTRQWANIALRDHIPFVFASSAAIYGNGNGPLNQYAFSKQMSENELGNSVAVLRFFNVYGPNEYHKGRMASTILHWYNQIQETGSIKIFKDSDQYYRDFIYVEDVCRACWHFIEDFKPGTYDLGTGRSESFERVARELAKHVDQEVYFDYIDMPSDLSKQYQIDTKADTTALTKSGFDVTLCRTVSEGIEDYVQFLKDGTYL
jgi:ADP-L-glycero-D-manno-heptose 6-epimerase